MLELTGVVQCLGLSIDGFHEMLVDRENKFGRHPRVFPVAHEEVAPGQGGHSILKSDSIVG